MAQKFATQAFVLYDQDDDDRFINMSLLVLPVMPATGTRQPDLPDSVAWELSVEMMCYVSSVRVW